MRALNRAALALAAAALASLPAAASAHVTSGPVARTTWTSWHLDPTVAIGTVLIGWLYLRGVTAMWRRAGTGRGVPIWRVWAFGAGLISLLLALSSPIDDASNQLLAAHMLQHMILILVTAPLLVLGAPVAPLMTGLPRAWRPFFSGARHPHVRAALGKLSGPLTATALQAVVFWLWHLPGPYEAALRHESLHGVEHLSMLLTAVAFWWAVLPRLGRRANVTGAPVLAVVLAGMQSGVLGALLTFSGSAWYPFYAGRDALWNLTPGEDQQIAGLVMWIPGGLIYLVAALGLLVVWLQSDERRADHLPEPAGLLPAVVQPGGQ